MTVIRPDLGPAERLVDQGAAVQLRAPELALVFGERAAALAEAAGSERLWTHAEGLAVIARVRLGQRAGVVDRAVAVLRTAEAGGDLELAAQMRVELALCARSVGVPLTGLAALRPVLGDPGVSAGCRAIAMLQFVGCMAPLGRRRVLERALSEADELATADESLNSDDRTLLRALVCCRTSASLRRYGDIAAGMESARRGIELLDGLSSDAADGIQLRVRLGAELVCGLLDRGESRPAAELAEPLLSTPPRACAIGPLAWLRLAVATRVHLPAGEAVAAGRLVREAIHATENHELRSVTARLWLELSHIEEQVGRAPEALRCLHEARMNEHAYGRIRRQALGLLIGEFGRGEQHVVDVPAAAARGGAPQAVPPPRSKSEPSADVPAAEPEPAPAPPEPALPEPPAAVPAPLMVPEPPRAAEPQPARPAPATAVPAVSAVQEPAVPRHQAGGVEARSVLERLGVTVSSGGRRRRGAEPQPPEPARPLEPLPAVSTKDTETALDTAAGQQPAQPEPAVAEPAVAEAQPPSWPPESEQPQSEPRRLDSVLAVFSNWTDDDAEPGVVAPRARRRRHEGSADPDSMVANGRTVTGEDPATGRHRSGA